MTTETKTVHDQLLTEWHAFQEVLELQQKETKQVGDAYQETKNTLGRLNDRLDELEVKLNRPMRGVDTPAETDADNRKAAHQAFVKAMRKGVSSLDQDERKLVKIVSMSEAKALSLGDDTAGGYLATPEYMQDIIKTVILYSPIRTVARVEQTSNRSLQIPTRTGVFGAKWVSETGQRSESKGLSYGLLDIPNFEMYAEVLASEQMLEDAAFDISNQISMETSEQFGVTEGAAFVNGTGQGQPEGILTNPNVPSTVSLSNTAITYNGLTNTFYTIKSAYAKNATWGLQRGTLAAIRQITDSQNRPLWDPGFTSANPPTIMGAPYLEIPDMPAVATNAYSVIFGDFSRGYMIVDRVSVVVKRLVEKYAETGQIAFLTRKRVGGQVILPEAFIKMQIHS